MLTSPQPVLSGAPGKAGGNAGGRRRGGMQRETEAQGWGMGLLVSDPSPGAAVAGTDAGGDRGDKVAQSCLSTGWLKTEGCALLDNLLCFSLVGMTPAEHWIPLIPCLRTKSFNPVYSNTLCCSHPPQISERTPPRSWSASRQLSLQ